MAKMELGFDENNNELRKSAGITKSFIERHLELGGQDDFLIVPNGGSGDCMFKAVSQAVFNGDESKHKIVRKKVVEFITKERWEKFSESIEVQHINGNNLLQRHWSKDPKQAYKMYMTLEGTLGSSSELTAAGELFRYNFATIQEYCSSTQRTYRVENCVLFEGSSGVKFHYFYFTGDYDNGHWEYLQNLSNVKMEDGTYNGLHRTLILGEEISVEDWFQRETENDNEADRMKIATNRTHHLKQESPYPFEHNAFRFNDDLSVTINNENYLIADVKSTDLFSVLAHECLQNEDAAHEAELVLMKHRYSYFEDVNYKLITQPYSHNFTVQAIKYCGYPCKGNIQDLISAADIYSFSFVLFMKLDDAEEVHQCKFTHVDRWGGESDRTLYFFMRLVQSVRSNELVAKWYRLIPQDEIHSGEEELKVVTKSKHVLNGAETPVPTFGYERTSSNLCTRDKKTRPPPRPISADQLVGQTRILTPRASTTRSFAERTTSRISFRDVKAAHSLQPPFNLSQKDDRPTGLVPVRVKSDGAFDIDEGMETDECLKRDHEKIFGSFSTLSQLKDRKDLSTFRNREIKLVKKKMPKERIKRATGKDLLDHPEKVRTLVRLSDRSRSGREITYTGSGFLHADDVLEDLKSQGLIKKTFSSNPPSTRNMFMTLETKHKDYQDLLKLRDENFNLIKDEGNGDDKESGSEVSYEHFLPNKNKSKQTQIHWNPEISYKETRSKHNFGFDDDQHEVNMKRKNKVAPDRTPSQHDTTPSTPRDQLVEECGFCMGGLLKLLFGIDAALRRICRTTRDAIRGRFQRYESLSKLVNQPQSAKQNKQSDDIIE